MVWCEYDFILLILNCTFLLTLLYQYLIFKLKSIISYVYYMWFYFIFQLTVYIIIQYTYSFINWYKKIDTYSPKRLFLLE